MLTLKIVPRWLMQALEADNRPITDVLNSENLLNTLSFSDVAFYEWLNIADNLRSLYGEEIVDTMKVQENPNFSLYFPSEDNERSERFAQEYERYIHKRSIDPDTAHQELITGLDLGLDVLPSHYVLSMKVIKQTDTAIIATPIAVVPEGHSIESDISVTLKESLEIRKDLAFTLIGILCTVYDFKVVASTELFRHFCRLSAQEEQLKR